MSQRDINHRGGTGSPAGAGEFGAAADTSAPTAQFRAFAAGPGPDADRLWLARAPGRAIAALTTLIACIVIALIIVTIVLLSR